MDYSTKMNIKEIYKKVEKFTMCGGKRTIATIEATQYVIWKDLTGCFVECGVWKGGQIMAMIYTLQELGIHDREIYLYDTFKGMTEPTDVDIHKGTKAEGKFKEKKKSDHVDWCYSSIEEVKKNIESTGYDMDKIHFIQGDILETIPETLPSEIALLRLDTDWYESTKHELIHLFPWLNIFLCKT